MWGMTIGTMAPNEKPGVTFLHQLRALFGPNGHPTPLVLSNRIILEIEIPMYQNLKLSPNRAS